MIDELKKTGRLTAEHVARWRDASDLLAVFDVIGRDGANALVKVDGGRSNGSVYTVVVSGGSLGESFFRRDGDDLIELLSDAIAFYKTSAYW